MSKFNIFYLFSGGLYVNLEWPLYVKIEQLCKPDFSGGLDVVWFLLSARVLFCPLHSSQSWTKVCLSIYLLIYIYIFLSIYLSIHLSFYLSIHLSSYLSIYLSVKLHQILPPTPISHVLLTAGSTPLFQKHKVFIIRWSPFEVKQAILASSVYLVD